jgi:hypothetical protein
MIPSPTRPNPGPTELSLPGFSYGDNWATYDPVAPPRLGLVEGIVCCCQKAGWLSAQKRARCGRNTNARRNPPEFTSGMHNIFLAQIADKQLRNDRCVVRRRFGEQNHKFLATVAGDDARWASY